MLITYQGFYEWHYIYLSLNLRVYVDSAGMEDSDFMDPFELQAIHFQTDDAVEMKYGW